YVTASLEMLYVILDQWTNSEGISIVNVSKFNSPLIIIDEISHFQLIANMTPKDINMLAWYDFILRE
ncbi:hypothetical protein, partial [Vibrio anguillarum]|uniref:hypothetical protein n=1 Tax=Vibrio anguillarum TaxID=55601 RepID=UPI001BE46116